MILHITYSLKFHIPNALDFDKASYLLRPRIRLSLLLSLPSRAPHELFINITDSLPRPCQRPRRAFQSTPARRPRRAQPPLFPFRLRIHHIARLRVAGISREEEAQLALPP
jgi:hypothetical protein